MECVTYGSHRGAAAIAESSLTPLSLLLVVDARPCRLHKWDVIAFAAGPKDSWIVSPPRKEDELILFLSLSLSLSISLNLSFMYNVECIQYSI